MLGIAEVLLKVVPVVAVLTLATMVLGIALGLFKKGVERSRWLRVALLSALAWPVAVGLDYAVFFWIFLPAQQRNSQAVQSTLTALQQHVPDIEITPVDGSPVRLSELQGRVVLLNFFATWCGPCKKELPELQAIWTDFGGDDRFRMFVIGREETPQTVQAFRNQHRYTFPMAADPNRAAFGRFASELIPRSYLISRDGTIVYQSAGYYAEEMTALKTALETELAKAD